MSSWWLKFSDPSEGTDDGAGGTPLAVPPVLPGSQEVLSASVVGVLIEDPVAIHNITGVDMAMVETVRHTGTVIHELHHVTAEVGLLIDTHPIWTTVLWDQQRKNNQNVYLISWETKQQSWEKPPFMLSLEDHVHIAASSGYHKSTSLRDNPYSWVSPLESFHFHVLLPPKKALTIGIIRHERIQLLKPIHRW